MGTAPTFHDMNLSYGNGFAEGWITGAYTDMCKVTGKYMTEYQMKRLSVLTATEFGYIKISEFMLFARWFESGRYDYIWGKEFDTGKVMVALRTFIQERNDLIAKYEQEQREEEKRKEQERHRPMTWEEYCAVKGINKINPLGDLFN